MALKSKKTVLGIPVATMLLRGLRVVFFVVALAGVFLYTRVGTPTRVEAATSSNLNFQARLLTSAGGIVPDGTYNVEYKLYNSSSSSGSSQGSCVGDSACLWTETYTGANKIITKAGYLSSNLGILTPFPSTINWDQDLWLTIRVGGTGTPSWDAEMNPRVKLTAVPYAFKAGQLAKLTGSNVSTLDFAAQTTANSILLPNEGGTLCIQTSTNCGFASASGSANYIQNTTTLQTNANFAIQSAAAGSIGGLIQGAASATQPVLVVKGGATPGSGGDLLQVQNSSGTVLTRIGSSGNATFGDASSSVNLTHYTSGTSTGFRVLYSGDSSEWFSVGNGTAGVVKFNQNGGYTLLGPGSSQYSNARFNLNTGATGSAGLVIRGVASQSSSLIELQDDGGLTNSSFNGAGNQLTLGRVATSGTVTQGKLVLSDGTTDGWSTTLQTATLTVGSRIITVPDTGGANDDVCLFSAGNCAGTATTTLQQAYNNSGTAPTTATINQVHDKGMAINGVQPSGTTGTSATTVLTVTGGQGGNNTSTGGTGGNGGALTFTSGAGGLGLGTSGVGGNGGNINISAGAGGTGVATSGSPGNLLLQQNGGLIGISRTPDNYKIDLTSSLGSYGLLRLTGNNTGVPGEVFHIDWNGQTKLSVLSDQQDSFSVYDSIGQSVFTVDTTGQNRIGTLDVLSSGTARPFNIRGGNSTGAGGVAGNVSVDAGNGLSGATAGSVLIGTGAFAHNTTVGSITGTSALTLQAGTGNITINNQGTGTVGVGNNATAQIIAVGNTTGTTSLSLQAGTGNITINGAASTAVSIGSSIQSGAITIGGTSQSATITLGRSTVSNTIDIGSNMGSSNTQSINIGTGAAGTTNVVIGSANAGTTTLNSAGGVTANATSTATSGTFNAFNNAPQFVPTSTSTASFIAQKIAPTIDFSNASPGAGNVTGLLIDPTYIGVPTGTKISLQTNTGNANALGQIIRGVSSQLGDLLQFQDNNGLINGSINGAGNQLTLGRVASSGTVTQGKLLFSDGTNSNFSNTLQSDTPLTASHVVKLPDEDGIICIRNSSNCGFATASASGNYIQNTTTQQNSANFFIQAINSASNGTIGGIIKGAAGGQTVDLFQLQDTSGNVNAAFNSTGATLTLGKASTTTGNLVFRNSAAAGSITLVASNMGAATPTLTLPNETGTICSTGSICSGYQSSLSFNNGITNTSGTVQLGGALIQNTTIDAAANLGLTVASTLSGGTRSSYPLTISQVNDATNNSTSGLLNLINNDTASTGATTQLLRIDQAASAGGIYINHTGGNANTIEISGNNNGTQFTATTTGGTGINLPNVTTGNSFTSGVALTTGKVINSVLNATTLSTGKVLSISGSASGSLTGYTSSLIDVVPTRTNTATSGTVTDTGNFLNLVRSNTQNGAGGTFAVTGALANLQSTCTQTAGTCTDSANILSLNQQYSNATGAVLNVLGAGTGNLATLDASNSSANGISIDVQSASSSQFAFQVTSNNGTTNLIYARADGNVGIGNTSPAALLSVGSSSQFQVSTAGAVTAVGVNAGSGVLQGTGGLTMTGNSTIAGTLTSLTGLTSSGTLLSTGTLSATGNTTLGDAATDQITFTGVIQGANPFILDGSNSGDGFETTISVTPTADRTYTIPQSTASTDTFCLVTLSNCSGGATSGWTDDGTTVRLTAATDIVRIGGSSSTAKLHVENDNAGVGANAVNSLTILGGVGGTAATGTAGTGAASAITGGVGGTATATATGGLGGAITFTAGAGGNAAATGTNGTGGNITLQSGAAGTGGTGGAAGNVLLQTSGGNVGIGDSTPVALLTVGTSDAFQVNASGNITTAGTANINGGSLNSTASSFALLSSPATIELGANATSLTIGGTAATNSIFIGNGTGDTTLVLGNNTSANNTISIGTSGTKTITVGSTGSTSSTTIRSGTGSLLIQTQGTGTLGVGNNAVAQNINIGNTTGATALTVRTGTGNYSLDGVGATTYDFATSTTTGTVAIGGTAQTGTLTVGRSTATNTINIGSSAGNANTQTISIGTSSTAGSTTTVNIGSTIAGTTTLQSQGGVIISTLGSASTDTVLCRNGTNRIATCNSTFANSSNAFMQNGNAFGVVAKLGTTDNFDLQFITGASSTVRLTFANGSNNAYFGNGITSATPTAFTINGAGSSSTSAGGASLSVVGGAGATSSTGSAGGTLILTGGAAGGTGNNNGGNVTIDGGALTGSGTKGFVILQGSAGNVGIGQTSPGFSLDVTGDIRSTGVYRSGSSPGVARSCSGGQVLQDLVSVGGIVTGGTCTAPAGGGWADSGTTVNLSTATDSVLIGGSGSATAKLHVVGDNAAADTGNSASVVLRVVGGNGAAGTVGGSTGGSGGGVVVTTGNGGNATGTGGAQGGLGGSFTLSIGTSGNTATVLTGAGVAGSAGGDISLTSGTGGNGGSTSGTGQNGGAGGSGGKIVIQGAAGGAGGAGGTGGAAGAAGSAGRVVLQNTRGSVGIGTNVDSLTNSVFNAHYLTVNSSNNATGIRINSHTDGANGALALAVSGSDQVYFGVNSQGGGTSPYVNGMFQGDSVIRTNDKNFYIGTYSSTSVPAISIKAGTATQKIGINTDTPSYIFSVVGSSTTGTDAGTNPVGVFTNINTADSTNTRVLRLAVGTASTGTSSRFVQFYGGATSESTTGTAVGHININNNAVNYATTGADFAEYYDTTEPVTVGDIVEISSGGVKKARGGSMVGVVSNTFGFSGNYREGDETNPNRAPIGLVGQIKVKVTNENGQIRAGDPVTASTIVPGTGAKAIISGNIIGFAQEGFNGTSGMIMVQINPTYYEVPIQGSTGYAVNGSDASFANLGVTGTAQIATLNVSGQATISSLTVTGLATINKLTVTDVATVATLKVTGVAEFAGDIRLIGAINTRQAITKKFKASAPITAGQVVVIDTTRDGYVKTTNITSDKKVIGVATQTVIAEGDEIEVAIGGSIQVQFDASTVVAPGDLITSANTEGIAINTASPVAGSVLGKATSAKDANNMAWILILHY